MKEAPRSTEPLTGARILGTIYIEHPDGKWEKRTYLKGHGLGIGEEVDGLLGPETRLTEVVVKPSKKIFVRGVESERPKRRRGW